MIAVDASVLVDVLASDPVHGETSGWAMRGALAEGELVVCDAVVAEVHALLDDAGDAMTVLTGLGIRYSPVQEAAAVRAGLMQRRFRERGGRRERVVADFLIGSHALLQCTALITRDAGFFRDYFKGLRVIAPGRH